MNLPELKGIIWTELVTFYYIFLTNEYGPAQEKCFKKIGCFSCKPPFYDPLYRPGCAVPVNNITIEYLLYTPQNKKHHFHLNWTENSIATSPFDETLPTKILIPGFNTTLLVDRELCRIKNELLKQSSYNVIIINWTDYDNFPYIQAIANGRKVGAYVALLLKLLKKFKNIDFESVHIIGHSLGAHVAGWVGERLNKIGRITGLDPAGPNFRHAPAEVRLDKSDAKFVDIIHTNAANSFIEGFGIQQAIGHVDFYPNGGFQQPASGETTIFNILETMTKNHKFALIYFRTSINICRFTSVLCNNYEKYNNGQCNCNNSIKNDMGFHAKKIYGKENDTLSFFLHTTASSPYCKEGTKCHVSKDLNVKECFFLYYFLKFLSIILPKILGIMEFGKSIYMTVKSFI